MPARTVFTTVAHAAATFFLDALSPPTCAACDLRVPSRQVFCATCAATVIRDPSVVDGSMAFAKFGGAIANALWRFKYESRADLARPLGHLLRRAVSEAGVSADVVVPVPLHPRRLAERGYNQSALLGRSVAQQLGVAFAPLALTRHRETAQQARLGRAERLTNVANAFRVRDISAIANRVVLVVDDVATTGSTLLACRNVLMDAGALEVNSVCLARAGEA